MDWQNVSLGIAGIVISIVTFIIGYKQTIGARQARASAADSTIIDILLRRLVLEQLSLSAEDVESVVDGKATELRLSASALRSTDQIADLLYTRVLESDLISQNDRLRSLETIGQLQKQVARQATSLEARNKDSRQSIRYRLAIVAFLAFVTSFLGVAIVSTASRGEDAAGTDTLILQFVVVTLILLLIGAVLTLRTTSMAGRKPRITGPTIRELTTFPDAPEGEAALTELITLSPFAARNLYQLGDDEIQSVRRGVEIGLKGHPEFALGLQELLDRRLVEFLRDGNTKNEPKLGVYGLTPKGRNLARLLLVLDSPQSNAPPPEYLRKYVHNADAVAKAGRPSADQSTSTSDYSGTGSSSMSNSAP